jgi:hypothetical protein
MNGDMYRSSTLPCPLALKRHSTRGIYQSPGSYASNLGAQLEEPAAACRSVTKAICLAETVGRAPSEWEALGAGTS